MLWFIYASFNNTSILHCSNTTVLLYVILQSSEVPNRSWCELWRAQAQCWPAEGKGPAFGNADHGPSSPGVYNKNAVLNVNIWIALKLDVCGLLMHWGPHRSIIHKSLFISP